MQRRHFLGILGGAGSSWPTAFRAHAQLAEVPVIGYLDSSGDSQRCQAGRLAGRAADPVQTGGEYEGGECDRLDDPFGPARSR
jgi:hypothetical protein